VFTVLLGENSWDFPGIYCLVGVPGGFACRSPNPRVPIFWVFTVFWGGAAPGVEVVLYDSMTKCPSYS